MPVYDTYDFGNTDPWANTAVRACFSILGGVDCHCRSGPAARWRARWTGPSQTLSRLYSMPASNFHDITSGSNGEYSAAAGYDLVTGLGTPVANALIPYLSASGP